MTTTTTGQVPDGTFSISKRFTFDAAHQLTSLGQDHACARLHGHGYRVEAVLSCAEDELVPPGFVADFKDLEPLARYIKDTLDHRNLNEVLDFEPTSELIARHLARWFLTHFTPVVADRLIQIRVSETEKTWATYTLHGRTA
ncbi:6-pyruvoyl trahydropterin synthase family protein [Streptomyces sp. SGAir0957]